jgi:8-oxo-dGTP pyrophosphatase MutT (NUDIX family)
VPRPNAPLFELGAGCYIVAPDGRLLLVEQERNGIRDWGCVGGGMEKGETIEACAIREAYEETGLRVRLLRLLTVSEFATDDGRQVVGFLFLATPDPWPQDVRLPEMDGQTRFHDYRWCRREDIGSLNVSPSDLVRELWPPDVATAFMRPLPPGG